MSERDYVTARGAPLPPPLVDRYHPPRGEVTWMQDDTLSVSSVGPGLTLSIDFRVPKAANREQIVVVRLRDVGGYFPTSIEDFGDLEGNLSVSATVPLDRNGAVEDVVLVVPYIAMPWDAGGITEVEIAVHEPSGPLRAIDYLQVELPPDFDRSPDVLTVVTHALVTLVKVVGTLQREEVKRIRTLLKDDFDLDDVGDQALRRILKTAAKTDHSVHTLAEVTLHSVPQNAHTRFVDLLYACAQATGDLHPREQRFISALLEVCGIHDHQRYGPLRLLPFYEQLELEPGSPLAEVKAAYKSLVRDYHPDRVNHLAKGFQEFAHTKTSKLNEAYAELTQALKQDSTPVEVQFEGDP